MELALAEADLAANHGDVPVGCVVVSRDGRELARGRNRRELDQDPTAHAEVVAMRAAAQRIGHWRLDGTTFYVTLEPCPMCAGALINARVAHVVYGASDAKAGAIESVFALGNSPKLNHRFTSAGGVLRAECVARLQNFFGHLRAAGEK